METKHTPGPWKIDDSIEYEISVVAPWSDKVKPGNTNLFGDYRGGQICSMNYNSGVPTKEQAMANAKLIASTPELLESLYEVTSLLNFLQKELTPDGKEKLLKAIDVIEKATL